MTGQHSCPLSAQCPLSTNSSKSYVPCSVAATSCPFALQPSEKPYFQVGSPFLPKTFAVSLAVARQCRDNLPSPLTKTPLQPGNAFLLPRHFLPSHLPWRPSCLCETKTDSEAHSVFPSHYSSTISTSAEIHLPHKYLASSKFRFFCSLHPGILFYSFCVQDNLSN